MLEIQRASSLNALRPAATERKVSAHLSAKTPHDKGCLNFENSHAEGYLIKVYF
jgi:hypothetical protein